MKLRLTHFREKWGFRFHGKCAGNYRDVRLVIVAAFSKAFSNDGVKVSNKKKPMVVLTRNCRTRWKPE